MLMPLLCQVSKLPEMDMQRALDDLVLQQQQQQLRAARQYCRTASPPAGLLASGASAATVGTSGWVSCCLTPRPNGATDSGICFTARSCHSSAFVCQQDRGGVNGSSSPTKAAAGAAAGGGATAAARAEAYGRGASATAAAVWAGGGRGGIGDGFGIGGLATLRESLKTPRGRADFGRAAGEGLRAVRDVPVGYLLEMIEGAADGEEEHGGADGEERVHPQATAAVGAEAAAAAPSAAVSCSVDNSNRAGEGERSCSVDPSLHAVLASGQPVCYRLPTGTARGMAEGVFSVLDPGTWHTTESAVEVASWSSPRLMLHRNNTNTTSTTTSSSSSRECASGRVGTAVGNKCSSMSDRANDGSLSFRSSAAAAAIAANAAVVAAAEGRRGGSTALGGSGGWTSARPGPRCLSPRQVAKPGRLRDMTFTPGLHELWQQQWQQGQQEQQQQRQRSPQQQQQQQERRCGKWPPQFPGAFAQPSACSAAVASRSQCLPGGLSKQKQEYVYYDSVQLGAYLPVLPALEQQQKVQQPAQHGGLSAGEVQAVDSKHEGCRMLSAAKPAAPVPPLPLHRLLQTPSPLKQQEVQQQQQQQWQKLWQEQQQQQHVRREEQITCSSSSSRMQHSHALLSGRSPGSGTATAAAPSTTPTSNFQKLGQKGSGISPRGDHVSPNLHVVMEAAKEKLTAALEHLKPLENNKQWLSGNGNSGRDMRNSRNSSPFGAASSSKRSTSCSPTKGKGGADIYRNVRGSCGSKTSREGVRPPGALSSTVYWEQQQQALTAAAGLYCFEAPQQVEGRSNAGLPPLPAWRQSASVPLSAQGNSKTTT